MAEKFEFLDRSGVLELTKSILGTVNERISERIVDTISADSDDAHVPSALAVYRAIANKTHLSLVPVTGVITTVVPNPNPNVLYLQRDNEADKTWMLYVWNPTGGASQTGEWINVGDTEVDLSGYWAKNDVAAMKAALGIDDIEGLGDFTELKATIDSLVSDVEEIQGDVGQLKTDVSGAKGDITDLKGTTGTLTTDVGNLKTKVGTLETDTGNLKTKVGTLETDVAGLKTDVGTNKTDISGLKNDVSGVKGRLDTAEGEIDTLQADVSEAQSDIEALETRAGTIETNLAKKVDSESLVSLTTAEITSIVNSAKEATKFTVAQG